MPETIKSIGREMKRLRNKKDKIYGKLWKTKSRDKRDIMRAETTSLANRIMKLSKKRGKLINKESKERHKERIARRKK